MFTAMSPYDTKSYKYQRDILSRYALNRMWLPSNETSLYMDHFGLLQQKEGKGRNYAYTAFESVVCCRPKHVQGQ
jgi:hypothetical protein